MKQNDFSKIHVLADMVPPLLGWYRENARDLPWRKNPTPYGVLVSELMLQQTRVSAVIGHYNRFMRALPDFKALAACDEDTLLKLWEGLGYYSRARNLHKAAKVVVAQYGGVLPDDYAQLTALPGVGPYTAGAVASIAFGLKHPAVDGNVLRVITRLTADPSDISNAKTKKDFERLVAGMMPDGAAGDFTQAMMELGATVCIPTSPQCGQCPVCGFCRAHADGTKEQLPVKKPKKQRRIEKRTVLLITRDGKIALQKREDTGLLAGMWELPSVPGHVDTAGVRGALQKLGILPVSIVKIKTPAKHVFTHVEWHMTGYRICAADAGLLTWASAEQLAQKYALPSTFGAYIRLFVNDPANGA